MRACSEIGLDRLIEISIGNGAQMSAMHFHRNACRPVRPSWCWCTPTAASTAAIAAASDAPVLPANPPPAARRSTCNRFSFQQKHGGHCPWFVQHNRRYKSNQVLENTKIHRERAISTNYLNYWPIVGNKNGSNNYYHYNSNNNYHYSYNIIIIIIGRVYRESRVERLGVHEEHL